MKFYIILQGEKNIIESTEDKTILMSSDKLSPDNREYLISIQKDISDYISQNDQLALLSSSSLPLVSHFAINEKYIQKASLALIDCIEDKDNNLVEHYHYEVTFTPQYPEKAMKHIKILRTWHSLLMNLEEVHISIGNSLKSYQQTTPSTIAFTPKKENQQPVQSNADQVKSVHYNYDNINLPIAVIRSIKKIRQANTSTYIHIALLYDPKNDRVIHSSINNPPQHNSQTTRSELVKTHAEQQLLSSYTLGKYLYQLDSRARRIFHKTLYIVRLSISQKQGGIFELSKPCKNCANFINSAGVMKGINQVIWSDPKATGGVSSINVNQLIHLDTKESRNVKNIPN